LQKVFPFFTLSIPFYPLRMLRKRYIMALSALSVFSSALTPFDRAQSLNAGAPKAQQKQYRLTMFGNTFVGDENTPKSQFKNSSGVTAAEHSRQGVLAHERAHDSKAKAAGLSTSGPVLETQEGLTVAGHVSLSVPQLDVQQAMMNPGYLSNFKRQSQGLVDSAHAPENAGIGGYGEMSKADHNVAAIGRANLAQASQVESQKPSMAKALAAKQQKASFGYHPSLMQAYNAGTIS
jgi:hypothetical protein